MKVFILSLCFILSTALGFAGAPLEIKGSVPEIPWSELTVSSTLLGEGSCGCVLSGMWRETPVAIKCLRVSRISDNAQNEFYEEVNMLWNCQSPNVVKLYGVCRESGHLCMILEKMHTSLYERLHCTDPINFEDCRKIAADVAFGLLRLHKKSIVHRDLKSANILLDRNGRAKIADFGIAKISGLTTEGQKLSEGAGTIRWCAPEILDLKTATIKADIFSYGMILWELLTHKKPYEQTFNNAALSAAVINGKREKIPKNAPKNWKEIIRNCWKKNPLKRYNIYKILQLLTQQDVLYNIQNEFELKYKKFLLGRLVYKKDTYEEIVMSVSDLLDPLEGQFDLSRCGNCSEHIRIFTGYPIEKIKNNRKLTILIIPRFLNSDFEKKYKRFDVLFNEYSFKKNEIGIFWLHGKCQKTHCQFLISSNRELSERNLSEHWGFSKTKGQLGVYKSLIDLREESLFNTNKQLQYFTYYPE